MKIIMLDIDGVLNSKRSNNPRNFPYFVDTALLENLKELLQRTGAKVVLASTWRTDPIGILAAKHFGIPFIDVTPDTPGASRNEEVHEWLSKHPEVDRYIVIDDTSDLMDDTPLFQPNEKSGLTMEIVEAAAKYLNGESDAIMRRPALVRLGQNVHAKMFKRDKS